MTYFGNFGSAENPDHLGALRASRTRFTAARKKRATFKKDIGALQSLGDVSYYETPTSAAKAAAAPPFVYADSKLSTLYGEYPAHDNIIPHIESYYDKYIQEYEAHVVQMNLNKKDLDDWEAFVDKDLPKLRNLLIRRAESAASDVSLEKTKAYPLILKVRNMGYTLEYFEIKKFKNRQKTTESILRELAIIKKNASEVSAARREHYDESVAQVEEDKDKLDGIRNRMAKEVFVQGPLMTERKALYTTGGSTLLFGGLVALVAYRLWKRSGKRSPGRQSAEYAVFG